MLNCKTADGYTTLMVPLLVITESASLPCCHVEERLSVTSDCFQGTPKEMTSPQLRLGACGSDVLLWGPRNVP